MDAKLYVYEIKNKKYYYIRLPAVHVRYIDFKKDRFRVFIEEIESDKEGNVTKAFIHFKCSPFGDVKLSRNVDKKTGQTIYRFTFPKTIAEALNIKENMKLNIVKMDSDEIVLEYEGVINKDVFKDLVRKREAIRKKIN